MDSECNEALVPTRYFDTGQQSGNAAFEQWQERVAGFFDSEPVAHGDTAFRVDVTSWHFGDLIASRANYGARGQSRTAKRIRSDQIDHYKLLLPLAGATRVDANGRRIHLRPGQLMISDMSRPERYVAEQGASVMLIVPRERLDAVLPRAVDLHGVVPQGASAMMLAMQLRSLTDQAGGVRQSESSSLSQSLVHLVAAAIAPTMARLADDARQSVERTLLRQICQQIDRNLQDESLTPAALAVQFKLSRATLYRLFEPLGGVATYIKEKRLARIHGMLASPEHRHHLSRLAELHGFSDASTLSKSFKQHFGYSPSEVRKNLLPVTRPRSNALASSFGEWVRKLRP